MSDIIQLLPESIANQIAAGEVVQRPASLIKELLENSIDAGATEIKVYVKDGGKALIQVVDNGLGMSETDARMAFERHATSKIRLAADLFNIRTMGFRGEALASIAAVARVEMMTKREQDEVGTKLIIEGSVVKSQEICQLARPGTNIEVRNLFFTVPARRNFLKSTPLEMKYVVDEFNRVALAHPEVSFSLFHQDAEVSFLPAAPLKQRIVSIFGAASQKNLIPVLEETPSIKITGFVGKPDFAKKRRGDQFFFVNHRFIKSGLLHYAVMSAYEDLLPAESFPFYCIYIDVGPGTIDINVHPTKQEIKFDDERLVMECLKVSVRHALGTHSIVPTLDFDLGQSLTREYIAPKTVGSTVFAAPKMVERKGDWESLFRETKTIESQWNREQPVQTVLEIEEEEMRLKPMQVHQKYIISQIKSGFILIDCDAAQERISYEYYIKQLKSGSGVSQQSLFPVTIRLEAGDAEILKQILPDLNGFGLDIAEMGTQTFVVRGIPPELTGKNEEEIIDQLLFHYKTNATLHLEIKENIARSMAKSVVKKGNRTMGEEEMSILIDKLFACEMPYKSPTGRKCFIQFDLDDLDKKFG
jgi:DNA mismatch repair protein MutL